MGLILLGGALALMLAFRERVLIALAVALVLAVAARGGWLWRWPDSRFLGWLGRISYSVFLLHFPVCLVANGVFERFSDGSNLAALAASLAAVVLSTAAGAVFHRNVESRRYWLPQGGR
jgi:peptidoglycan/LPS O-acetylase OafA/YrhL